MDSDDTREPDDVKRREKELQLQLNPPVYQHGYVKLEVDKINARSEGQPGSWKPACAKKAVKVADDMTGAREEKGLLFNVSTAPTNVSSLRPFTDYASPQSNERFSEPGIGPSNACKTEPRKVSREGRMHSLEGTATLYPSNATSSSSSKASTSKDHKLSSSVVNSRSVTPPPNISTAPGGRQPKASSWTFQQANALNQKSGDESSSTKKPAVKNPRPTQRSWFLSEVLSQLSNGRSPPLSILSTATTVPPLLTMDTASAGRPPYILSTRSSSPIAVIGEGAQNEKASSASREDTIETTPASDAIADSKVEASPSSAAGPSPSQPSEHIWSKCNPLSPEEVLLNPLTLTKLAELQADAPLFLPANADRLWYTGFVKPWNDFSKDALAFWFSEACRCGFDSIADHPMIPARVTEREHELSQSGQGAGFLQAFFQREVLETMQKIYIRLSEEELFPAEGPTEIFLGDIADEDLGNAEQKWEPTYIVKASRNAEDESLRVLGQVEYLGGRPDALTTAIRELTRNSWGSLRCVLGTYINTLCHSLSSISSNLRCESGY